MMMQILSAGRLVNLMVKLLLVVVVVVVVVAVFAASACRKDKTSWRN